MNRTIKQKAAPVLDWTRSQLSEVKIAKHLFIIIPFHILVTCSQLIFEHNKLKFLFILSVEH